MSTIAWDGRMLASSRLALSNDGLCEMRKVMRLGRSIYAGIGHADAIERLFKWVQDGGWDKFPSGGALLIEVNRDDPDHVFVYRGGTQQQIKAQLIAFGTGKDHAIKVLNQGATAIEAVKYASVWDDLTAGGIDVIGWSWETTSPVDMPDLERLRVLE